MKLGLSTYSLQSAIEKQEMLVTDVIRWIADNGGEHVEIVPAGYSLVQDPALVDTIRKTAAEVGIEISNYAVSANFLKDDPKEYEQEILNTMRHVDIAHQLGAKRMRHDVASRPIAETSIHNFEADLPKLRDACQRIADYASSFGIITSVENHGYYIQASDRVQRLINAVDRPNFKATLDVGNFLCVDEDPASAVSNNIPYASMVHLKDFYRRPSYRNPGEGWFRSAYGNYLRGAIIGQGDIDMAEVVRLLKRTGYDGYISIEFEGMEDCKVGSRIGMNNARRLWDET